MGKYERIPDHSSTPASSPPLRPRAPYDRAGEKPVPPGFPDRFTGLFPGGIQPVSRKPASIYSGFLLQLLYYNAHQTPPRMAGRTTDDGNARTPAARNARVLPYFCALRARDDGNYAPGYAPEHGGRRDFVPSLHGMACSIRRDGLTDHRPRGRPFGRPGRQITPEISGIHR